MAQFRSPRGRGPRVHDGWSWRTRRFSTAVVTALPVILVPSCSTLGPGTTAATGAAAAFHRATQDGDGNAACGFLAPATVQDLEGASGQGCRRRSWPRTCPAPMTCGTARRSAGAPRC